MSSSASLAAYRRWQDATRALMGGPEQLEALQDLRYRYAAAVGRLLTQPGPDGRAVDGPVLYGVLTDGAGVLYVGQSANGRRRLRDLSVGESHHLATTVPPEAWDRVVVVRWPDLLLQLRRRDFDAIAKIPNMVTGEGLERLLQADLRPVLNSRRRTPAGGWRSRNSNPSQSRSNAAAEVLRPLYNVVLPLWQDLASRSIEGTCLYEASGRVVLPTRVALGLNPPSGNDANAESGS